MSPPTSACEELVGRPNHQVMMSQAVAPSRVARRSQAVTILGSIVPFPIVEATFTPKRKAATKLKKAAQSTASLGVRTRVETTVAIAKGTITVDIGFSRLGVFENDVANHLDNVLTLVRDRLHQLIDFLQLDDRYRIIGLEKCCD